MRYIVAVSGGIDSVVLLDMLARRGKDDLIVAHFDHGIRPDSADDARFVAGLADQYQLPFVSRREELGAGASEELARNRRYAFLGDMAREYSAMIATAHHADDVIETIAINLARGTGWRGGAVFSTTRILRPLLSMTKQELRAYALRNRLEWVEDSTNASGDYLRNQIRQSIARQLSGRDKQAILALWQRQLELKVQIDAESVVYGELLEHSRYFLTYADEKSACELLRAIIMATTNLSPTRPQLARALLAIKTAHPRTIFELGAGVRLRFTARTFIVETP